MKKHLFLKSLLVAIGLLVTSLTAQVWATMANFIEGSYIYIDVTACADWASSCTLKMNWFDSQGNSKGNYIGAEYYTTNIYRFQIPSDGIGGFQIIRLDPNDHSKQYNYSNKMYAKNRSYDSQNCLCAPSGAVTNNANFTWSVYHPFTYIHDGDDSKVSQIMTHSLDAASTKTYIYSFRDWDMSEYEFGSWRGTELTKTNGVYAFYVTEGRKFILNGYKENCCETKSYDVSGNEGQYYATKTPSADHHRDEGTYQWTGSNKADYSKTGIKIEIVSNAYELYVGESTTFTITAVSPLTDLVGLEIWEEGVKVEGTPSGSGTSRTFSFTATTPGIRNISARLHFTFNGHDIYLCAADMKIRVYEKYKIKVQNTLDWDALKLYMFRNADNAIKNAAWPGTLVTEKIANDGEHDWYFVELDSKFDRFMLANSDASKQTYSGGMSYDKATYEDKCYYMEGNSNTNNWTTEMDCPEFYRIKSVCAGGTYYSNILMNEGKFSMYTTTAGTLTLQHLVGTTWTDLASTITRTGITRDTVYVADFNGSNTTNNFVFYDGNYHIRCKATTANYLISGEGRYGTIGTQFTYFSPNTLVFPGELFNYYWVDWFDNGQTVIATVGNDYNDNLAGELGADENAPDGVTIKTDDYDSAEWGGNVRFGYNPSTNYFSRSIIAGSGKKIKIQGDNVDPNKDDSYGEEASFNDASAWVYTIDANIKGQATATISTTYVTSFDLVTDKKLMGGKTTEPYHVLITYDFKTNRLLAAWEPNGDFEGFDLQSNLMVVRTENGAPTVLNIRDKDGNGSITPLTDITRVYTAFEISQKNWEDGVNTDRRMTDKAVSPDYTDEYYWISLPYECHVKDIFGIEGYGNGSSNSHSWVIQTYRGDLRAEKGWWAETNAWWYDLDLTDTLKANQGYVIRLTNLAGEGVGTRRFAGSLGGNGKLTLYFPSANIKDLTIAPNESGSITTTLDSLKCTKWHKRSKDVDPTEGENNPIWDRRAIDSNWRIIGSPSFDSTKIVAPTFFAPDLTDEQYKDSLAKYGAYGLKYFYTWRVSAGEPQFTVTSTTNRAIPATHAYLVQYAGDITWQKWNTGNPLVVIQDNPVAAPKRHQEEETTEQTLRLVLQQGAREADVAYISRMAFGATMGYDLNMDLSKMINANSANIYTMGELYKMAGNCIPDTVTVLPVGVQLAADGAYTFAIPDGTYGTGVVLIDKVADTRTNLALTDYTVNLTAGTYDERFEIELSPIAQTPTDIETISDERLEISGVRKVMVDGVLYIVKDGVVFDAQGNRVR